MYYVFTLIHQHRLLYNIRNKFYKLSSSNVEILIVKIRDGQAGNNFVRYIFVDEKVRRKIKRVYFIRNTRNILSIQFSQPKLAQHVHHAKLIKDHHFKGLHLPRIVGNDYRRRKWLSLVVSDYNLSTVIYPLLHYHCLDRRNPITLNHLGYSIHHLNR